MASEHEHPHQIEFTVDGETLHTSESQLTPRQIMGLAGIDPDNHYLTLVEGRHQKPLRDLDEPIHMHQKMTFISTSTGPTPVS